MSDNLQIMSLNVRGIQTPKKRKDYFIWLDKFKSNIILLQDTHSCALDENNYKNHWGHSVFFSHGLTNSRGVATIIPKHLGGTSNIFYRDMDGRILIVEININNTIYYIINVYAPSANIEKEKLNFLEKLKNEINPIMNNNIIIGGDWNVVLDLELDKKGGSQIDKYPKYREKLKDLLEDFDLVDCWRLHHPNKRQYTWRQTKPRVFCRLDMLFISANLLNIISNCCIDLGHKTDHSSVKVNFKLSNFKRGKGIWKFNNSLLHNKDYINLIKTLLSDEKDTFDNMENKGFGWDYVKMRIRSDTMMFAGTKNKLQKLEINRLETRLKQLELLFGQDHNESYEIEINTIKRELEEFNSEKLMASIFRSKCSWAEDGERNSKFFLNLEKHNYENKSITKLEINNNEGTYEVTDEKSINEAIKKIYKTLYSENDCNMQLLEDVTIDLPKLSEEDKNLTNGKITEAEALKALKSLSNGKTPGIDGLTTDFYKFFWKDVKHFVINSINYAFESGEMSNDQKLGIITLSPKKNKIRLLLKNWRPITLLTVDYKLIAKSLASRLETILPHYIYMNQFGYVKGRYIGENVRCVIDINEICNKKSISALAIQIDFEKAFDSINWNFMLKTLERMNFGTDFINWVKVLYNNTSSVVINNGVLTEPFKLYRGVHQGCPLSALLFIILVQVLQHMLYKRDDISGLVINGKTIKLLQMADDTTIFTTNHNDVGRVLRLLKAFYKISGLKINLDKTVAYLLGPMSPPKVKEPTFGLTWKSLPINLLGITITTDEEYSYKENFSNRIDNMETLTKIWCTRNLSLKGKLTVINSLLIPKLVYPATILNTPKKVITRVEQILSKFLWNWKKPKIKKDLLIRNIKNGGIKAPCIDCKINAWQSIWAIRCLKNENEDPLWVHLVSAMLPDELTLGYLLKSRPTLSDLDNYCPHLPPFYCNIIINWVSIKTKDLITKDQIRNECIWLNNLIISNGKPLYSPRSIRNKLYYINDICKDDGTWKDIDQINLEFNLNINFLDYLRIRQCIPHLWKQILNNTKAEDKSMDIQYNKMKRYNTLKSRSIYWLLLPNKHDVSSLPNSHKYWIDKFKIDNVSNYLIAAFTCIRITSIQALQYKIINRIFNCNHWLTKIKILNDAKCRFCNNVETIEHYFYDCDKTSEFWKILKNWWNRFGIITINNITEKDVILGSLLDNNFTTVYNCILLIAKGSIYNTKSNNLQPDFYKFLVQLKFFLKIEEQINIKNNTLTKFETLWSDIFDNI